MSGGASPQLRQADLHEAQTVVQVAAELLLGDQALDVLVRRGDHAHVERLRGVRSQLRDALLLQHAQQAHLHVHRHLADLVEEQRAAVRELELPHRARLARPGERPALVAEQLGGQQVARQGAAVDGHELAVRPLRRCSARATTSLPVPVSPNSSTFVLMGATFCTMRSIFFHSSVSRCSPPCRRSA